jgi:hypothetical protein
MTSKYSFILHSPAGNFILEVTEAAKLSEGLLKMCTDFAGLIPLGAYLQGLSRGELLLLHSTRELEWLSFQNLLGGFRLQILSMEAGKIVTTSPSESSP